MQKFAECPLTPHEQNQNNNSVGNNFHNLPIKDEFENLIMNRVGIEKCKMQPVLKPEK